MTLPDWIPFQCLNCGAHRGPEDEDFAECGGDHPEACDCGAASHVGGNVCPVCGQSWKALPPEDWDGTILSATEEPFKPPPKNHYTRSHLAYSRTKCTDARA